MINIIYFIILIHNQYDENTRLKENLQKLFQDSRQFKRPVEAETNRVPRKKKQLSLHFGLCTKVDDYFYDYIYNSSRN